MKYLSNVCAMVGSVCIASIFFDGGIFAFICGIVLLAAGFKLNPDE